MALTAGGRAGVYGDEFNGQVGALAPSSRGWASISTALSTANRLYVARFVPVRDILCARIGFIVSVAAGSNDNCLVGIYDSNGATLLASSLSTASKLNSTGLKAVDLQTPYRLLAGFTYYVGHKIETIGGTAASVIQASFGNNLGVRQHGAVAPNVEGGFIDVGAAPLPANLTGLNVGTSTIAQCTVRES